jgi:hypothetical protein
MIGILGLAAIAAAPVPHTADELLASFLRTACLSKVDRVEALRSIAGPNWRTTHERTERDMTFEVDGPVARQDQIDQAWEVPLREGRARISVWKIDYADPASEDISSALIWIRPEQAVAAVLVARSFGLELQPAGPRRDTPGGLREYSGGKLVRESRPTGWLQHYEVTGQSVDRAIHITAMREWGPQHPDQQWRFGCGTRINISGR